MKLAAKLPFVCTAFAMSLCTSALAQQGLGFGGTRGAPGAPADDFTRGVGRTGLRNQEPGVRTEPIWTIGVTSRLTLSDNINLAPEGEERSGTLLEVSPYVRANVNRPRLQGQLTYALRNFYTSPDVGYEGPLHDLAALGNVALKDDWLWLAGQALVYQVNTSPFGTAAADPASRPTNRTRYSRVDLSPYVRGQLGAETSYEAAYAFNSNRFGSDETSSTAHQVRGEVLRNPGLSRFGFQASADTGQREFDNGSDYETTHALLAGLYRVSPGLDLGAGVDYTKISVVTSASGKTGGWGPTVLLNWRPSPRTAVNMQFTDAYYGNTAVARVSHRAASWTFGLRYDQGIVDGSEAGLTYADTRSPTRDGQRFDQSNPLTDELGDRGTSAGFGTPLASGILGGALVDNRRLAATVGWLRLRNSAAFTAFTSRSETVQTNVELPAPLGGFEDLQQRGALLRFAWQLTMRTTATVQGAFTRSESDASALQSDLTVFDVVLGHELRENAAVSLGYRRSDQRGSTKYQENAILATVNLRL